MPPGTAMVNQSGYEFLAGASLSEDKGGAVGTSDHLAMGESLS